MRVKKGDIIVCKPGFANNSLGDSEDAGAGYVDGMMTTSDYDSNTKDLMNIFWSFHDDCGVYQKAVRLATQEEKKAFEEGIGNIKNIQQTKTFKISYESIDGEFKKAEVDAFYETAAVSSIKDLKRLNYVMTL